MPQGPNGEVNGTDILVQVEHPADSGVYVTIGSQRGATYGEQTAAVDMSSKEDRKRFVNPGRYSSTITLEHLYIPTSSGQQMLRNAMRNGTYVRIRRRELGATLETASCVCTGLSLAAPDQEASVSSANFDVNGAWS